jgi:ammonia channel protein AmtB
MNLNTDTAMMLTGTLSGGVVATGVGGLILQTILLAIISGAVGAVVAFFVTRWLRKKFPK